MKRIYPLSFNYKPIAEIKNSINANNYIIKLMTIYDQKTEFTSVVYKRF